jgi:hypothetical protein
MGAAILHQDAAGQTETEERSSRPHVILLVQLKAEKIPVNFLLFTGSLDSALL